MVDIDAEVSLVSNRTVDDLTVSALVTAAVLLNISASSVVVDKMSCVVVNICEVVELEPLLVNMVSATVDIPSTVDGVSVVISIFVVMPRDVVTIPDEGNSPEPVNAMPLVVTTVFSNVSVLNDDAVPMTEVEAVELHGLVFDEEVAS